MGWIYLQQTRIALAFGRWNFLQLSSIKTVKTPNGQTRKWQINSSIDFASKKPRAIIMLISADVKVFGQLFSQTFLNESLLFYNFYS